MSENSATRTIRSHLKAAGEHSQRFEDKLSAGIPDTMSTINNYPVFLEGKFIKSLPSKDRTLIRFGRKGEARLIHQRNWLVAHRRAGGLSFWWVRVRDDGWYLFEDKFSWLTDGVEKQMLLEQPKLRSAKELVARLGEHVDRHTFQFSI